VFEPTRAITRNRGSFDFTVEVKDTSQFASFCVRAKDLADSSSLAPITHWWSTDTCLNRDTVKDTWAPNIILNPAPTTSTSSVTVTINDVHLLNGDTIGWDRGIDSIWFTNALGMAVPPTIHRGCTTDDTSFDIVVTNANSLDSIASVCVHVVDCAGNQRDTCWVYLVRQDNLPPNIQSTAYSRTKLDLVVTDSTRYDRGLRHTILDSAANFDSLESWDSGRQVLPVSAKATKPNQSSYGVLRSIDLFGSRSTSTLEQNQHSASIPLSIWVEDIRFRPSTLAKQSQDIKIPVLFAPPDTFKLARKGILKYQFAFQLIGDNGFTFVGVDPALTASYHFDVSATQTAGTITVTGVSNDGRPLIEQDSALVYVIIHAQKDATTRQTVLTL